MSCSLYVRGLPAQITLEELAIYFQSSTKSGGGDVDLDACNLNGNNAVIVFEKPEYLENVQARIHEIDGHRLEISDEPFRVRPVPKKRKNVPAPKSKETFQQGDEKEYLGEVRTVIVSGLSPSTTNQTIQLFFENSKRTGGGEIEKLDRCQPDVAYITFISAKVASQVLNRDKLELEGYLLKLKEKQPEPKSKETIQQDDEKQYLGEIRTVIVNGLSPTTTNQTIQLFFENSKRTGGGEIENFDRCQPEVAHITFASVEVASQVLKHGKLELEGYLLKLKEKQPEILLPLDRKKLYVENLNPNTTEDSLSNYIEVTSKVEVCDVQFGENKNALITLSEEPDMKKISERNKPLEGATLKFSFPPVCNSILVTGLNRNTTIDGIEMYFESEKYGGGKIYGDIIYQKDQGVAVISFCHPRVVESLMGRRVTLNGSDLCLRQHYQFLNSVKETSSTKIKLNKDVVNHVVAICEKEFCDLFGSELLEVMKENSEELSMSEEMSERIEVYMEQFTAEEVPFSKKLLDISKAKLYSTIAMVTKDNVTVEMDEKMLKIKIAGTKEDVNLIYQQFHSVVAEMEKELNITSDQIKVPEHKLKLLLLHGVDGVVHNDFHVEIKIEPSKGVIIIKGTEKQVDLAAKELLQKCSQITEDNIDLNEPKKRFLQSGGLAILNNGLKTIGLKGMVSFSKLERRKAKVLFVDAALEDVHSYIKNNMSEKHYMVDEDSLSLLKSNKWEEFCENVATDASLQIFQDERRSTDIALIGNTQNVEETYEKLQEFMKRNTIIKKRMDMGEGYARYLITYCRKDLEEIEEKLEEQSVTVHFEEEKGTIEIDGTKEGVKTAMNQIREVQISIATDKICFDKQRMQQHLQSEEGNVFLKGIEFNHKCLIQLTEDNGELASKSSSNRHKSYQGKPTSMLLCSYETQEKISLKVFKGDITVHGCEVIVNAANEELKHVGGVAKSILDAGGKEIQDECDAYVKAAGKLYEGELYNGSPGKLGCKRLIHAVGPRWDSSKREKMCKILSVTCTKVLEEAMTYRSIALPAIGSGIFGIPKDVCADIMIQAAQEFSKKNENCALEEIHFVNIDDASGRVFVEEFRRRFGGRSSFKNYQANAPKSKFRSSDLRTRSSTQMKERKKEVDPEDSKRSRIPGNFVITKRNMKISVVVGDLSTYKADVLVNTTGENLNLDSNPCSRALSNEAGPSLQAECSRRGKLQVGEVVVTSGGNLLCDDVYHVVCVQWNGGQGENVLRNIIKNCLKKCNLSGKKSIAFPAIGTGVLGFPHDNAAKIFFEEVKEFEQRISNCSIKEVSFVVYTQDGQSIQAFKKELMKQAEWGKTASDTGGTHRSQKKLRRKPILPDTDGKNVMCIQVGDERKVEILKGDITKETTDVIAHLTNPNLFMGSGVATALVNSGGQSIQRECEDQSESRKLQVATTVLTTAGRLYVKYIAHMVASSTPNSNEIDKCIKDCLKSVSDKECESISFPAIGTGHLKHDFEQAATTILTSVTRFLGSSLGPLKTIRIVLKDDDLVSAFQASAKKLNEGEEVGVFRKIANLLWKSESPTITVKEKPAMFTKKLFLEIYAKDVATIRRAKDSILKIVESQKKKEKLEDDSIGKLSNEHVKKIEKLCEMSDIKVTIEKELNRILLVGHSEDIAKIYPEIFQVLKQIGEEEKEKEKAAMHADFAEIVSQGVQWFWVDPTNEEHEEYHKRTNATIEKAYCKKKKSVIFYLQNGQCEIVFDKMEETNLDTNEKLKVIRKDLKAEMSLPEYWEPQPTDTSGKELDVHLVTLDPKNPDQNVEYKNIVDHFNQTASNHRILQIQRIQNPSLLKLYLIKKQSLDDKNGSNEKFLFHGTRGGILNTINKTGLNRSYAGNTNGVAFGKGVYFARDALMSVGYASPMPDRKRYMYYTRVAVGQYAVGNSSMLVPPAKGVNSNDSYDSVVNNVANPTIFVLFYDNQYYPEYLITFM